MKNKKPSSLFIKFMLILTCLISGSLFIVGIVYDTIPIALLGAPFLVNVVVFFHEIGHAFACKLCRTNVNEICIPLLTIRKKSISVNTDIRKGFYCAFVKTKNNVAIYLFGPLFSLLFSIIVYVFWLLLNGRVLAIVTIASFLHFIKSIVPIGNSDMNMAIKELRKE